MNAQKTISDSKELFYKEFPYVIPHIYRRVADELIVELHLISHLKDFKQDDLFAAGLNKTFNDLTIGYKPTNHVDKLFNAICKCSGFDAVKIKEQSTRLKKNLALLELGKIDLLTDKNSNVNISVKDSLLKVYEKNNKYHSRLFSIGILTLVDNDKKEEGNQQTIDKCKIIGDFIGFSQQRVEKDISAYLRSIEKIDQFMELQKELNKKRNS